MLEPTAKGLVHGTRVVTWPVDAQSGKPHHREVKERLGIAAPTPDFHVYPDGTFALWSHRGIMTRGDRDVAVSRISAQTGLRWRGKPIEEVQGKQDDESTNPHLTAP